MGGIYQNDNTLSENDPGSAYITPSSKTVTISANSTTGAQYTTNETMDNVWKYWYAVVTKVDAESGSTSSAMAGAEYTLYRNGTKVKTYTVGNNGKFTTDEYPCTESDSVYTLKETKAPAGYQLSGTTYTLRTGYSHYTKAVNSFTVTVSDQMVKGKIQVQKRAVNTVSGEKKPEEGATYQVWLKSSGSYASAGVNYRDEITVGTDGKATTKDLPAGTYCIQQKTGWAGYELDPNVYEAAITENGATVTKDTSNKILGFENKIWTGKLTVLKVDGDTNTPLAGATILVTSNNGYSKSVITGADGKAVFDDLVYGPTYQWMEMKSPKGYRQDIDNSGFWSVESKDATIEITAKNYRIPGKITVTKQTVDEQPLSGASFLLEYKDGSQWKPVTSRSGDAITKGQTTSAVSDGCLTTGADGTVTFEGLWADKEIQYRITEVKAPEGYELMAEPVYEGTIPVAVRSSDATSAPDEVDGSTYYYYTLPITVRDGRTFTLPMTGGSGIILWPAALSLMLFGGVITAATLHPYWFRRNRRSKTSL